MKVHDLTEYLEGYDGNKDVGFLICNLDDGLAYECKGFSFFRDDDGNKSKEPVIAIDINDKGISLKTLEEQAKEYVDGKESN